MSLDASVPSVDRARSRARATILASLGLVALSVVGFASSFGASAQSAPPGGAAPQQKEQHGGDILFPVVGNRMQKNSVLYSHEKHLAAGIECEECHEKVFKKKLNADKFKMADVNKGEFCGVCHTEQPAADVKHKAFPPKGNCAKCHAVKVRDP